MRKKIIMFNFIYISMYFVILKIIILINLCYKILEFIGLWELVDDNLY